MAGVKAEQDAGTEKVALRLTGTSPPEAKISPEDAISALGSPDCSFADARCVIGAHSTATGTTARST